MIIGIALWILGFGLAAQSFRYAFWAVEEEWDDRMQSLMMFGGLALLAVALSTYGRISAGFTPEAGAANLTVGLAHMGSVVVFGAMIMGLVVLMLDRDETLMGMTLHGIGFVALFFGSGLGRVAANEGFLKALNPVTVGGSSTTALRETFSSSEPFQRPGELLRRGLDTPGDILDLIVAMLRTLVDSGFNGWMTVFGDLPPMAIVSYGYAFTIFLGCLCALVAVSGLVMTGN